MSAIEPTVAFAEVSADELDVEAHRRAVSGTAAGAEVVFCGVVRDHDGGRGVRSLEYVAHPTAEDVLRAVALDVAGDPDVMTVAVSHRVGVLAVGEVALVAAAGAAHREAAFAACRRLVDETKRRLPVWKRQVFSDGTDEWVNCP